MWDSGGGRGVHPQVVGTGARTATSAARRRAGNGMPRNWQSAPRGWLAASRRQRPVDALVAGAGPKSSENSGLGGTGHWRLRRTTSPPLRPAASCRRKRARRPFHPVFNQVLAGISHQKSRLQRDRPVKPTSRAHLPPGSESTVWCGRGAEPRPRVGGDSRGGLAKSPHVSRLAGPVSRAGRSRRWGHLDVPVRNAG